MLVRFSVENYRCFRERVELSMVATPLQSHPTHVVTGASPHHIPLLKLAVIYGANASGKSNLVRALETARRIILSPAEAGKPLALVPYKLDKESLRKPTRFEFEIRVQDRYFAYGFVASTREVEEEWLYELNGPDEVCLFERQAKAIRAPGFQFVTEEEKQFFEFTAKGTLPNRLFLTESRERNLEQNVSTVRVLGDVIQWFQSNLQTIFPNSRLQGLAQEIKSNQIFKEELGRYLRCFDTGVEGIDLDEVAVAQLGIPEEIGQKLREELKEGDAALFELGATVRMLVTRDSAGNLHAWRLVFRHNQRGSTEPLFFDFTEESDGTRRLTDLAPVMIRLLSSEHVFVVDEFDRSLHPEIAHSLIANFLQHSVGQSSQFIVTTHETTLLQQHFLRPDEVWFVEKKPNQGATLVSLAEYQLNGSKDLQKDYLQGRFGGVPVVQDFSWLGESHAKGT